MHIERVYELVNEFYCDGLDDERGEILGTLYTAEAIGDEIADFKELRDALDSVPLVAFLHAFEPCQFNFERFTKALESLRLACNH